MKISKSALTGEEYEIPSDLDDSVNIDNFIKSNHGKKVVVVQGLGFVGAVMSIVCANSLNEEYAVIGIDLPSTNSFWKIRSINEGIFPIVSSDKKVEEFFKRSKQEGNFYATYDNYAFKKADIVIVDINLDVQKDNNHIHSSNNVEYDVDISSFKSAIESIGENCKEDVLVLIETTVPPGTTLISSEIIKDNLKKRNLSTDLVRIGHSYERVMPGPNYIDSIQNFYRVYSGIDESSANAVESFLKTIIRTDEFPLTRLKNTNSTEISKVLENSYRAMNISFIVEWSRYAEEADADLYEIVNAIRMRPTHKNMMLPGIGVGGYCLTKDPLLASWSRQNLINGKSNLSMSEKAVTINDRMPLYAYKFFKKNINENFLQKKKIFLLGVSYAPDVGDTRYSPVELFYDLLVKENFKITITDPFINYWEERSVEVQKDFSELDNSFGALIFTTGHSVYKNNKELIEKIMDLDEIFILDTIGVLNDKEIKALSVKHDVKVLGRGDL